MEMEEGWSLGRMGMKEGRKAIKSIIRIKI
jgi:hypothetical protein